MCTAYRYDDPNLCALYIDRRLRSRSHIVQLLGRINRTTEGKQVGGGCVAVVDFHNRAEELRGALEEYAGVVECEA